MATFVDKPWDGAASRWPDTDSYCSACLIDDNPSGADKKQALCHLPVKEPGGAYNKNALSAAAGRLMQMVKSANVRRFLSSNLGNRRECSTAQPFVTSQVALQAGAYESFL